MFWKRTSEFGTLKSAVDVSPALEPLRLPKLTGDSQGEVLVGCIFLRNVIIDQAAILAMKRHAAPDPIHPPSLLRDLRVERWSSAVHVGAYAITYTPVLYPGSSYC
jgi:hypothetical protein